MTFAVIVTSREVRHQGRHLMTPAGTKFWVTEGEWGPSSTHVTHHEIPKCLLTFRTRKAAENFAKKWKGHPLWCQPNGEFEVIEVMPRIVEIQDGFKRV